MERETSLPSRSMTAKGRAATEKFSTRGVSLAEAPLITRPSRLYATT